MFRKALIPLDGSDSTELVIPYATQLAKGLDIPLVLLSIVEKEAMPSASHAGSPSSPRSEGAPTAAPPRPEPLDRYICLRETFGRRSPVRLNGLTRERAGLRPTRSGPRPSIPPLPRNDVEKRLAGEIAPEVLAEQLVCPLQVLDVTAGTRDVRRYEDVAHLP